MAYVDGDPKKGVLITLENKGRMIMPVAATVTQTNGKTETVQLPVDIWFRGGSWTFKFPSTTTIAKVVLDQEQVLPDMERKNNEWRE